MSYNCINEKYKKILQEDSKKRKIEEERELNEILDDNKKKALNDYRSAKEDIEKLLNQLDKKLTDHASNFMMGKFKGTKPVEEIKKFRNALGKVISSF